MQLGVDESVKLAKKIKASYSSSEAKQSREARNVKVVLCPSFDSLESVARVLDSEKSKVKDQRLRIFLGAQDMFYKKRGQFTGEESPFNLQELGVKYVILGHSERRKLGETDEDVRKKLLMALKAGLVPIVCVGETLAERKAGKTKDVISKQITAIFKKSDFADSKVGLRNSKLGAGNVAAGFSLRKVIIAYEPVWAIGTGVFAEAEDAKEVRDFILKLLRKYLPSPHLPLLARGRVRKGEQITVIYGGSVDSKNIFDFLTKGGMEGALVGGASLNATEFLKIVKKGNELRI